MGEATQRMTSAELYMKTGSTMTCILFEVDRKR